MVTLTQIIHSYKEDGHEVDGLFIGEVQSLEFEEIIEIINKARGRDIIIKKQEDGMLDGQWYKYSGIIDPNFNINKYL